MNLSPRRRFILVAVFGYIVLALVWIFLSDELLLASPDQATMRWLSTVKGVFFVLTSGIVFYFVLRAVPADTETSSQLPGEALLTSLSGGAWPLWLSYLFAALLVMAAFLLRQALLVGFTSRPGLILYVLPIILSALLGGMGPGLLATTMAAVFALYTLLPSGGGALATAHDAFQWSLLVVSGLTLTLISEVMRRARQRERQQAQQCRLVNVQLQESEERYRELFKANPLPMWVYDLETLRFLAVNNAAVAHYGYSRDEFLAMTIRDIRPPEDVPELLRHLNHSRDGLNAAGVWQHCKKDGGLIDVEISTHTLAYKGRPAKMVLAHDITERLSVETSLRQAHERLRRFVDANIVGIVITTAEGNVIEANDYYLRMIGFTREELEQGRVDWRAVTPAEWLPADERALAELRERGVCTPYEKEYVRRDGTRVPVLLSDAMLPGPGGQIVAFALDVTSLKQTETALREREVQYRNLADAGLALIWTAGPDKLCNYFNRRWLEFTGRTLEQELGNGWAEGVYPEDFERCLDIYATSYDRRVSFDIEYRLRHASGEYRWIRDMGTPNYDSNGAFVGYLGHCFDVTDRKLDEQERQRLITELEKRNSELERFTYTVSHDLKSPLVTILGFIGQLEQDLAAGDRENVTADLAFISHAAGQMRELLDSLLQLSRAGRALGEPCPVALEDLARDAVEQLGERLVHAAVRIDIPSDLPRVMGDPLRLRGVFQNLLENAGKFTAGRPEPWVEVGCKVLSGEILCHVRDNGIGIPQEYQEKIFGLFEQLDPNCGGTGIGLAIVRRIVEGHGGRVWVESAGAGAGSTFYFTLPV